MTDTWKQAYDEASLAMWNATKNLIPPNADPKAPLQAALDTLKAHGWTCVPLKATPAIIEAVEDELRKHDTPEVWGDEAYTAMITAAQKEMEG